MAFWDVFGPMLAVGGAATGIGGLASPALAGAITGAGMGAMKGREKQQAVEDFNKYAKERTKYSWASGLQDIAPQMKPGIWGDIASQAGLGAMTGQLLGGAGGKAEAATGGTGSAFGGKEMAAQLGQQGSQAVQGLQQGLSAPSMVPPPIPDIGGQLQTPQFLSPEAMQTSRMESAFGAPSGLSELQNQMAMMNPYKNFWSLYGAQGTA